jgi:probable F420-dependent oxidoreductase
MKLDLPLSTGGFDAAEAAQTLAEAGVDGAYTFEGPTDVFVPLARAAGAASIDLYSNIAVSFPRSPVQLTHTAWDLQRLNGGRFLLGLGSQVKAHVERRYGAAFDHPADRMADQVSAIKAIFASWQDGTPLNHQGRFWQLDLMPPLFNPGPLPTGPPPILVAAVGPRMTTTAVTVGDGVLLHPFTSDRFVSDHTRPAIDAALAAGGKPRGDLTVVGGAIVALSGQAADQQTADDAARNLVAFYGSTPAYRPVLDSVGQGDIQPELRTLTRQGRWAEMAALVDDEVLSSIVIRGTAAEVAVQLHQRYDGLADRVGMTLPHAADPADLAALAAAFKAPPTEERR